MPAADRDTVLAVVAIVGYLVGIHRAPAPSRRVCIRVCVCGKDAGRLRVERPARISSRLAAGCLRSRDPRPVDRPSTAAGAGRRLRSRGPAQRTASRRRVESASRVVPGPRARDSRHRSRGSRQCPGVQVQPAQRLRPDTGHLRDSRPCGESPTALVCYASSGFSSYLRQCEQIVAKVTLVGQTSYDLSPDAAYAGQLGGLIGGLDRERLTLRREMRAAADRSGRPRDGSRRSVRQRGRVAGGARTTARGQCGPGRARELADRGTRCIHGTRRRSRRRRPAGYGGAERQVDEAEAGVDAALESFALLGYNHT